MNTKQFTRRTFLIGAAATMAGCATSGSTGPQAKRISPNEKLNVAGIGVGGKGRGDIALCASENIIALADVDFDRAARTFEQFPDAKQYKDFRVMLDKHPEIDAVTISTPDHMHAYIALIAMEMGKHVYVQKPLTHNIAEARLLHDAARKYGVVTQMGNQGHSGEGTRQCVEMIQSGAIGTVKEVHCWTDRPGLPDKLWWPQGVADPYPGEPVPATLDWDMWLGVAAERPYNKLYAPFNWRGWWDYGCGALGDMACHVMDAAYWALDLDAPTSVECVSEEGCTKQTGPLSETIRYEFPAKGARPAVTVYWYDGGRKPAKPEGVPQEDWDKTGGSGSLFVGDKGYLTAHTYGENPRLLPESLMNDYVKPAPSIRRVSTASVEDISDKDHRMDWINACKDGPAACSNFDYAGPFTETVLLGTIAARVPGKLLWDSKKMKFTNSDEATAFVTREYRKGWELAKV